MPTPKDVYDNPELNWSFITSASDDEFEGQHFDRKEAGRVGDNGLISPSQLSKVREQITECISAFTNAQGGLLVVGVSSTGDVKGLGHLNEEQLNSLTAFNRLLRNQTAIARTFACTNENSDEDEILLIYVPHVENGICETLDNNPKAWLRSGKQNVPLSAELRDQLKREKGIVIFENTHCCPFHPNDVDKDVLQEFRKVFLADSAYENYTDEEVLHRAGAIDRDGDGYVFTNAGYLFFAVAPQRHLSWAYIRLLRFEVNDNAATSRGLASFDRKFDGALPQQIRKIRSFFRESGFFKVYQKRNPEGGFIDDPEFPTIAVDEAIVNAVTHRDYGVQLPIECIHYKNAFAVTNSGRIIQRGRNLPDEFSLNDVNLDSMPRNSKLIEWLKLMKDEQGAAFVRALSEGTKRMRDEMVAAGLPAPLYEMGISHTEVTLYNDAVRREALLRVAAASEDSTEFTNLFPVNFVDAENREVTFEELQYSRKDFMTFFRDTLSARGWYVDRFRYSRIVAHRQGGHLNLPSLVQPFIRFYPAYEMQLREYSDNFYLAIDYTLEVKNIQSVRDLLEYLTSNELEGRLAVAQQESWQRGRIKSVNDELTLVYFFDLDRELHIPNRKVIPDLPPSLQKKVLKNANMRFDLSHEIKRHSLSLETGAARKRAEKTLNAAHEISENVFPLTLGESKAILLPDPVPLFHHRNPGILQVQSLAEPAVEFNRQAESPDIREGITKFGAYENAKKTIELVPVVITELREDMVALIQRLKTGKYRYKGSERTFSTRLTYNTIVTIPTADAAFQECQRLLDEHPDWVGNEDLNRLFLVHTPEQDYARDDEQSPYYQVKRLLLENGIPCQMVNTPTLRNPDWKDLNLTLNIVSKCGVTPWVLHDKIPDADFFIGLSYTQNRTRNSNRLVGYATVFNKFGRWEFYSGNTDVFSYEERREYFAALTQETLSRLSLSETPYIYFHYSAKFSKDDRKAILDAARRIRPQGTYSFVSINSHHNIRLYDDRAETDGSLSRGKYVITAPNQLLLSTTGYNPFRKALGTPKPLEITLWTYQPQEIFDSEFDLRALAIQTLSLTKLNWASTEAVAGEPITTKFAGSIAYLTAAFLRQKGGFRLHPVLESTPWFL